MRLPLLVVMPLLCLFATKNSAQEGIGLVDKITSFSTKSLDTLHKKTNDLRKKNFVQTNVKDSTSLKDTLVHLPLKYFIQLENKVVRYNNRITSKTVKTLERLSRWENKIKAILLEVNPEAAERLFGNNQITFYTLLNRVREGKAVAENYQAKYDEYRDQVRSSINYLKQRKEALEERLLKPLDKTSKNLAQLDENVKNSEALEQFIRERRKLLIDQSLQVIGNSKYLQKISKDSYYYIATLKNYKELFRDHEKAEQAALALLNKIPAFTKFIQENSLLAQLFGSPNTITTSANLAGLQTRASINSIIQSQIANGGPGAQQMIQQNIQQAQAELNKLKDKILESGGKSSDDDIPDFKLVETKSKTFRQRLEIGSIFQSQKANNYFPSRTNIGLSIGYKLNDKSVIGVGGSYIVGTGRGWNNIHISNQGVGLRSFIDWRMKGSILISGGFEQNYNPEIYRLTNSQGGFTDRWQQSGLLGISKVINIKSKISKKAKFQLLWDFLSYRQIPVTQPFLFRVSHNL